MYVIVNNTCRLYLQFRISASGDDDIHDVLYLFVDVIDCELIESVLTISREMTSGLDSTYDIKVLQSRLNGVSDRFPGSLVYSQYRRV
jgi:hypothetical protein